MRNVFAQRVGVKVNPRRLIRLADMVVIETAASDDAFPFCCISYVWGTGGPAANCTSVVAPYQGDIPIAGDRQLLVQSALRTAAKDGHSYAWVDILCIDQTSDSDKHYAVNHMGKYYFYADTTYCLVQPHILEAIASLVSDSDVSKAVEVEGTNDQTLGLTNALLLRSTVTDEPWFTRVWPLQEMLLAKRAILLAGDAELPMVVLARLSQMALRDLTKVGEEAGHLNDLTYCALDTALPPFSCTSMCAVDIIRASQRRACFHKEDHFYGVLGLLPTVGRVHVIYGNERAATDEVVASVVAAGDMSLLNEMTVPEDKKFNDFSPSMVDGKWYACDCALTLRKESTLPAYKGVQTDYSTATYSHGALTITKSFLARLKPIPGARTVKLTNLAIERIFARILFKGSCYSPYVTLDQSSSVARVRNPTPQENQWMLKVVDEEEQGAIDVAMTNTHYWELVPMWVPDVQTLCFMYVGTGATHLDNSVVVSNAWGCSKGGVTVAPAVRAKSGLLEYVSGSIRDIVMEARAIIPAAIGASLDGSTNTDMVEPALLRVGSVLMDVRAAWWRDWSWRVRQLRRTYRIAGVESTESG